MKVGYVRCSTIEQNEARQMKMMEEHNIEKVFVDKASGKDTDRENYKSANNILLHLLMHMIHQFLLQHTIRYSKHVCFLTLRPIIGTTEHRLNIMESLVIFYVPMMRGLMN